MIQTITLLSAISILAPALVGAIFYARLLNFARILYGFVLFTLVIEIAARILFECSINNMFIFHLFSFGELTFIALIYRNLSTGERWKQIILYGFVVFQSFALLNLLFFDNVTHFNAVQRYFEMIFFFVLFGGYVLEKRRITDQLHLRHDPALLLTAGFMVYFLGTFYLFLFGKELLSGAQNNYWIIHGVFNIFLNLVFVLVFVRGRIPR
ncbi:MAG: hypothetical protein A3D92_17555 [Bacteroidetes bacterium RIFCSPHIGHO2_02_FULL_44_7]|nr:MAG: hypothetical protein A3D92_17555 [Bacteroidetes bacterium RIFCSPHIGHO2_02_FULL_44_7]